MVIAHDTPHDRFIAAARPACEIWRSILALISVAAIWLALLIFAFILAVLLLGETATLDISAVVSESNSVMATLILIGCFLPAWPALWLSTRVVLRRPFRSLFGPGGLRGRDLLAGISVIILYGVIGTLLTALISPKIAPGLALDIWIQIAPIAIILIFFQATAEELIFRGLLQQQLSARFNTTTGILLPSLLFGAGHYAPEFGENLWLFLALFTLSGLIAADATRRTGNLSFAIGLHVANNILAILILGYDDALGATALWRDTTPLEDAAAIRLSLFAALATMIALYALVLFVAARLHRSAEPKT